VLRHRGITNNARFCAEILQAGPGDVWVNPMPLFHTAGCVLFALGPVQGQFTQVLPPGFDPRLVLHLTESEHGTMFGGVPTMLLALLDHPDFPGRDLSSTRYAFAGGATVPPTLVRRVESAVGVPFFLVFAQTEASPCITQTRLDDAPADRAETLGRPHPQVEVKIADPVTGETVQAGAVGEILTRGYHVMKGYFDNPAATAEAIDAAGWLHTGDLGSMDERGYCRIEGRVKEMIIRGGENIYPREIEQLLHARPGVADVAADPARAGVSRGLRGTGGPCPPDHGGEHAALARVGAVPLRNVQGDRVRQRPAARRQGPQLPLPARLRQQGRATPR
jgi:fatty-acyl-CoA synthase